MVVDCTATKISLLGQQGVFAVGRVVNLQAFRPVSAKPQVLIDGGADLEAPDLDGDSPLMCAVINDQAPSVVDERCVVASRLGAPCRLHHTHRCVEVVESDAFSLRVHSESGRSMSALRPSKMSCLARLRAVG